MNVDEELLYNMIYKRKSFHLFRNIGDEPISPDEVNKILDVYASLRPLFPTIRTAIKIVPGQETTCKRGQEYCILLYSEKKENYLQNIGFLGEQLDLYLVSRNIGTLWYGIGKPETSTFDGLDFVIMLAIAQIDGETKFRRDMFKSKRRPVEDFWIGDPIEGVTEIVRFAPSSCNTQPWLIEHTDGTIKVFRYKKPGKRGIMPVGRVSYYNRIDIGIFLCLLELCLAHRGISYEKDLYDDPGCDDETTLAAIYTAAQ